jgi:hydrogenase expression/formation protein HypD
MEQDVKTLTNAIASLAKKIGRPMKLMEVCGTHTVAIFRHGIRGLLPENITLLSGPGCPVCVTSIRDVDTSVALAKESGVVLVTFGDMMRVPGGKHSLYDARAEGADVRIVYSPLDALKIALDERDKKVVFFATGFETTSPVVAATVKSAAEQGIENFFVYPVHKLVPPALSALLEAPEVKVDGLILPGHVSTIIGTRPYEFLASDYGVPSVITGFGAEDILEGILMLLQQMASGRPEVGNQYKSVVRTEGNPRDVEAIWDVFETADAVWRGIGTIPQSGLELKNDYRRLDIRETINVTVPDHPEPKACSCGEVLRGLKLPPDCPLFGKTCTPEKPVGACMVSTEGSCAAYYKYGGF